jgi:hypothetical protein
VAQVWYIFFVTLYKHLSTLHPYFIPWSDLVLDLDFGSNVFNRLTDDSVETGAKFDNLFWIIWYLILGHDKKDIF